MRRLSVAKLTLGGLLVAASVAVVGCSKPKIEVYEDMDRFTDNPTPALVTIDQRQVDLEGGLSHSWDSNGRLFWNDLGRFGLSDRPSRLTPHPSID